MSHVVIFSPWITEICVALNLLQAGEIFVVDSYVYIVALGTNSTMTIIIEHKKFVEHWYNVHMFIRTGCIKIIVR